MVCLLEYVLRMEKIVSEKVERLSQFKGGFLTLCIRRLFTFTFYFHSLTLTVSLSLCPTLLAERIKDLRVRLQEEETASKNIKRLPML